jgi:hypothetical protein
MEDIAFAASHCQRQRRVFLCDGDALIIPQKRLLKILKEIEKQLPWVTRLMSSRNSTPTESVLLTWDWKPATTLP